MSPLALLVLAPLLVPPAQDAGALASEWNRRRDLVLVDVAGRHYDVGAWCWKVGLRPQATSEMLGALALSDGRYRPAKSALAKMRNFDDDDWKRDMLTPTATLLVSFEKRVERAKDQDRRDFLELAQWAVKKKLDEEARGVYEGLLQREGEPLELDEKGCLRVGRTPVPEGISKALFEAGVDINGRRYLRDEFLAALPAVGAVFESGSEALRVRSTVGAADAERLHALGLALLPHLEARLGGRPGARPDLFVFARRSNYDAYLEAAGLGRFRYGSGVADRKTNTAALCAEGVSVEALALHELTHLYQYGLTRAILPDWYSEGLAETYGGPGTYRLDGKTLEVGGMLDRERLALLSDPETLFPLRRLLELDAGTAFSERGWLFYAQSWAFLRFLRTAAGPDVAQRLARWEAACTGAALGADETDVRAGDPTAARALFTATFGAELDALEVAFRAWVAAL